MPSTPLRRERILRKGIEATLREVSLPEVLRQTAAHACALLRADHGAVGLVEPSPYGVRIAQVVNLPDSEVGSFWPSGTGLAGRVLSARAPVVARRYVEIEPQCAAPLREHGVVGVPIVRRGRVTGIFGLGSSTPRQFDRREVALLSQFARACGAAIENARLHASRQVLLEEARLTSRVAEALNREVSVGEVVRAYLAHVQATVRFHTTVVLSIFDDEGVRVGTEILGRWSPEGGVDMTRIRREYTRDRLDDLLDQGKPVYSRDATTDRSIPAALRREQKADGRPALGLVPLVSQGRRIGLVVLSSPGYVEWDEPLYRPIELTASLLASALDSRMEHERANAARAAQLLDAERGRIAAELHDSVTQLLFAIHLNAEALRRKEAKDGSHGEQLAEMARTALRDMRSMLAELQPSRNGPQPTGVTDLGQALHQHANALAAKFRLTVSCAGPAWAGLDDNERHCVYRIAQEALSNAVKHSAATNVSVRLWLRDGRTTLEVKDDGIGLAVDWEPGMGMRGMRDRAARVGAQIAFVRRRGGGTVVRCRLGRRTV